MRPLGEYKKINIFYSLNDRATQVLYRQVLNEAGNQCQVTVRSMSQTASSDKELKLHIADNLDSVKQHAGKKDYYVLYHIDNQNFSPSFEIFYPDIVCFTIPDAKTAIKMLVQSIKAKGKKLSVVRQLSQYMEAINDQIFDIAENIASDMLDSFGQKTAMSYYLEGMSAKKKGDMDKAFSLFASAYEMKPEHPLYLFELAMLVYKHGKRSDALTLCAKFAQNFPMSLPINKAGLELSILNRKFDYLDLFFARTDRIPIAEDSFFKTYNAALSVYVRYLAREKKYVLLNQYVRLLSLATKRELYWQGIIIEFNSILPLGIWPDVFNSTVQKVMQSLFPKTYKIVFELVKYGVDSATITIKNFEAQGLTWNDEPGLNKLVKRIELHF